LWMCSSLRGVSVSRYRRRPGYSRCHFPLADCLHDAACLFIALSKRRHELALLAIARPIIAPIWRITLPTSWTSDQHRHRIDSGFLCPLYSVARRPSQVPGQALEITIPFVLYGIFRYLHLVHHHEDGGNPSRVLFTDPVLLTVVALWALSVVLIIYL